MGLGSAIQILVFVPWKLVLALAPVLTPALAPALASALASKISFLSKTFVLTF